MTRGWPCIVVALLALAGCATTYQPMGGAGGYEELQLNPNTYRVSFQGNGYTRQERVADFALLRASDLTLAQGSRYFVVVSQGAGTQDITFGGGQSTGSVTPGTLTPNFPGGYAYSGTRAQPVSVSRHRAELVIQLVPSDETPPPGAHSAESTRDQIRRRYGIQP